MADVKVKGLAELQKFLDQLPAKMEANIMRSALRAGANVIKEEVKANVPVASGVLRDGIKVSTSLRGGRVTAKIKTAGKHGYLAGWVEFGTAAHKIVAKTAKGLLLRPNVRASSGFAKRWMNIPLVEAVDHPGTRPRPFMRPALDARAQDALVAVAQAIKKRLTKQGLEGAADVEIEAE